MDKIKHAGDHPDGDYEEPGDTSHHRSIGRKIYDALGGWALAAVVIVGGVAIAVKNKHKRSLDKEWVSEEPRLGVDVWQPVL